MKRFAAHVKAEVIVEAHNFEEAMVKIKAEAARVLPETWSLMRIDHLTYDTGHELAPAAVRADDGGIPDSAAAWAAWREAALGDLRLDQEGAG